MEEEGSLSYWSVLFKANSFADLLDRLNMIQEIAEADKRRLEEMDKAAEAVAAAQVALEDEKSLLEETKAELDAIQAQLMIKREEADAVLVKLNAKGEEFEALMEQVEADEEALLQQIAQAEKEYNKENKRLQEEERKRQEEEERRRQELLQQQQQQQQGNNSVGNAVPSDAYWLLPCSYTRLSSPYGYRVHPITGIYTFHHGVDLAASSGTPIKASRAGVVTTATWNNSAGNYVSINHGDGFSSSYLHMTHYIVSPGQRVEQGQIIGYVGSTGASTGPHLHFAIYYNGVSQNPAAYMNF
jgi:murein DD-endopeptidase MepM/ murein hydrolase activator NlpD